MSSRVSRPLADGYDTLDSDVLHGMNARRISTAVTTGLVAAGLLLSACGATTAGTAISPETASVTTPKAPVPTITAQPAPTTTAPRPSGTRPTDPLAASVHDILKDIDGFWEQTMGLGSGAVTFSVEDFDSRTGVVPKCGDEPYDVAGYCELGDHDEMQWDRAAFEDKRAQGGEMAMALTLSHEYGHAVQDTLGKFHGNRFVEVQADCLAGVYMSARGSQYGSLDDLERRALPTSPIGQKPAREKAFEEGFATVPDKLSHCLSYQG